jgi:hypothetical protein
MVINIKRQPHFFQKCLLLALTLVFLTFGLVKTILPVIHDTAYGRVALCCNHHKVKISLIGKFLCFFPGHNPDGFTVCTY